MKKLHTLVVFILSSLAATSMLYAGQVYIRSDGPANGDGKSWETAFNSIDAALANIQNNPDDTTFWVAAGIYSPLTPYSPNGITGGAAGALPTPCNPFDVGLLTFNLPDRVKIYGGFKGDEKSLSDRSRIPNPLEDFDKQNRANFKSTKKVVDYRLTVLDGEISNSWHVVTIGNDIAKTGAHVGLFDLTIRGGYADGPDAGTLDSLLSIQTLDYAHDTGGGIYARFGSNVDLFNIQFINNAGSGTNASILANGQPVIAGGGAISAFDAQTTVNVKNCYFNNNSAIIFGAGGGAISSNFEASLNVSDCIFTENVSNRSGGAIRSKDGGDTHVRKSFFVRNIASNLNTIRDEAGGAIEVFQGNLFVDSSTFFDNEGLVGGGAIFFHTFLDDGVPYFLDVNRCFFEGNRAGPFGGGALSIFGLGQHVGSKAAVRNSHFTKNSGGLGGAIYVNSYNTEIKDNHFEDNLADAWGGAVAVDNFGKALLFPPLSFADREIAKICDCSFKDNKTRGLQSIGLGFPSFFTPPGILNIFAIVAPAINGIPRTGIVDQFIVSGGGGIAVLLAGVAEINNCTFKRNDALNGTGGAILVGGATGTVTDLDTGSSYQTFDYASAFVKKCTFANNCPNKAEAVDLAKVGKGPDGVQLIFEH